MRYTGEVRLFAGNYTPDGWVACLGQKLPINGTTQLLFNRIGITFGGDGLSTFALPDATNSIAVDPGNGFVFPAWGTAPGPVATAAVPLTTIISLGDEEQEGWLGEVKTFAFNFPPAGWLTCDGSSLAISEFGGLFEVIGTKYGGDGVVNFSLPDLRGTAATGGGAGTVEATTVPAVGYLVMNFCINATAETATADRLQRGGARREKVPSED
jgi:microcystin-dependent protein